MNLLEELQDRIVCRDGVIGTLLLDRGVAVDQCLEELGLTTIAVPFLSEIGRVRCHAGKDFWRLDSNPFRGRKCAWSVDRKSRRERR
jgi:hypothetical protein